MLNELPYEVHKNELGFYETTMENGRRVMVPTLVEDSHIICWIIASQILLTVLIKYILSI